MSKQNNKSALPSRILYTMIRVSDLDRSVAFYKNALDMNELRRENFTEGRFTLVFIGYGNENSNAVIELTYNWDREVYQGGRNFGHLAFEVDDVYALCQKMLDAGITINVPPRDGHMAFFRSPDNISIELLQKGQPLPPAEPWVSMPTVGEW